MALYRVKFNEMAKILETKDIARINYSTSMLDVITEDGEEYILRYKAFSSFKRVFKILFRNSIFINMNKVLVYHLGGQHYNWHEVATALLKSPRWLDFLLNLNPQEYIKYETQEF